MTRRALLLLLTPLALWCDNVDVPLDSPLYAQLERLASLGALQEPLPVMKPYNTAELAALVESIDAARFAPLKKELRQELGRYETSGPIEARGVLYGSDKEEAPVPNAEGTLLKKGASLYADARLQLLNRKIGIVFTPQYRDDAQNRNDLQVGDFYARYRWKNLNVTAGREALWMGSGKEGTLLLSNHAKSLDMLRLSSARPFAFHPYHHPLLNRILGKMELELFLGRMHRQRGIERGDGSRHDGNPKLLGLLWTIRPFSSMSLGIYHTAMFGGGGREENFETLWKISPPFNGNDTLADQKSGITAEWYLPNRRQPLKLYGEWAKNGGNGGEESYIAGILLSDTAHIKGLQTSYEHLRLATAPHSWYSGKIYTQGYTNNALTMGYPAPPRSSRDTLRLTYVIGVKSTYSAAWIHENDKETLHLEARYRIDTHSETVLSAHTGPNLLGFVSFKWMF